MKLLRKTRALAVAAVALAWAAVAPAQSDNPFRPAPPEVEEALRARVSQFYEYFKMAKFRQAEDLVVEEAKEHFYGAKKSRIFGYEIRSMNFSEDLKEAQVLVTCLTPVPGLGSKPLSVPLPSTWKSIDGEWYLYFETRTPGVEHDSPAGKMHFSQELGTHGSLTASQPATLESLKEMYALTPSTLTFSFQGAAPVTKTFQVENRSKGELTLVSESKGMPGVTVDAGAGKIAAGESLTVSVTYLPSSHVGPGEYPLQFAVQPIAQHFDVKLVVE